MGSDYIGDHALSIEVRMCLSKHFEPRHQDAVLSVLAEAITSFCLASPALCSKEPIDSDCLSEASLVDFYEAPKDLGRQHWRLKVFAALPACLAGDSARPQLAPKDLIAAALNSSHALLERAGVHLVHVEPLGRGWEAFLVRWALVIVLAFFASLPLLCHCIRSWEAALAEHNHYTRLPSLLVRQKKASTVQGPGSRGSTAKVKPLKLRRSRSSSYESHDDDNEIRRDSMSRIEPLCVADLPRPDIPPPGEPRLAFEQPAQGPTAFERISAFVNTKGEKRSSIRRKNEDGGGGRRFAHPFFRPAKGHKGDGQTSTSNYL